MTAPTTARLSLYQKAEQELYKLDRTVKAKFYDFCHHFRDNPRLHGLRLKPLKGDSRVWSARIDDSYRALLTRTGIDAKGAESWLVIAVRHRKDVYEQLSVAVNRITGEIEFVDLSVVGESALRRAGINLTPAEPDEPHPVQRAPQAPEHDMPLLAAYEAAHLRDLGVAESLIELALAVVSSDELDQLVKDAPLLSKDVLYGLAAGMGIDDVRAEITDKVATAEPVNTEDFAAALERTTVTTVDDALRAALEEGTFREWKVFLHPAQRRLVDRDYSGPARVSGGPGTGKTIVALHRVGYLARKLPPGEDKPILLTTFTKNLALDLRARLASLLEPDVISRVDIQHVDSLSARVIGQNTSPGRAKNRVDDRITLIELRTVLAELGETIWEPEFLKEEWEQVILGQSIMTRAQYFKARRAGRGRALTRPDRSAVWAIIEQYTARLDKAGIETWAQAAERAARYEIERARRIQEHRESDAADSGARDLDYRYRHIVVDEAQDLRAAHWKMLRAMVEPGQNDLFIAGDTHQRIYDNQVSLGAVGVHIRGRSSRLTLSYRTTKEILAKAFTVLSGETFDDLDDGTDTLAGYRSVLHGPDPIFRGYRSWQDELKALTTTVKAWTAELAGAEGGPQRDPRGLIAVCVAELDSVSQVMNYLAGNEISCSELTKDGPNGDGDVHVGTMHRFKGLEYQKLAIVGVCDGTIPRPAIDRYLNTDPPRYAREQRKARSLLFVAATRARDALRITWHDKPSRFLPR
jgi:mRNA-degrading endonuclease RelE of RelBE toxin-antitoxin system